MKIIYTILLLLLTNTGMQALELNPWSVYPVEDQLQMDNRLPSESSPLFDLSSDDFLTMKDIGLSNTGDINNGYTDNAYGSGENALKVPISNGAGILGLLATGYLLFCLSRNRVVDVGSQSRAQNRR